MSIQFLRDEIRSSKFKKENFRSIVHIVPNKSEFVSIKAIFSSHFGFLIVINRIAPENLVDFIFVTTHCPQVYIVPLY